MRKNEIGSEFWEVPISKINNTLFPRSAQWFISGRSALHAIIRNLKNCLSVAMPSWCCESMIKPFVDEGVEVRFYSVFWENGIKQELRFDCDALFLIDYFGYAASQAELSRYNGIVIRDVTHSLLSVVYADADYCFGSLRKWCGIWTGGYAWAKDSRQFLVKYSEDAERYAVLRERAMQLKNRYINGYTENEAQCISKKAYLDLFEQAEELLEIPGVFPASERDVYAARFLDVDFIKSRRRQNAHILRTAFSDWLLFPEMKEGICPLFVPVFVPNGKRDKLRRYLIDRDIYCPVHWPVNGYYDLNEREEYIYKNELSLVCDQRYTEKDMKRIVDTIKQFEKEEE